MKSKTQLGEGLTSKACNLMDPMRRHIDSTKQPKSRKFEVTSDLSSPLSVFLDLHEQSKFALCVTPRLLQLRILLVQLCIHTTQGNTQALCHFWQG